MRPLSAVSGTMAPLPLNNVDTDQIMPKQFLKRVERTGYGRYLFHDWARGPDGEPDPDFVLNKPEYGGARVLVAGANFGSGSSREHAPWGLQDWGFEAVVAESFADIFYNNCTKIGLLPVALPAEEVRELIKMAEKDPETEAFIHLPDQTMRAGDDGFAVSFEIDPFIKYRLMEGLDDIGLTMRHAEAVDSFEAARPARLPRLPAPAG